MKEPSASNIKKLGLSHIYWGVDSETGELRSICDVPSGLSCNCICAYCGNRLVAKKGEKRKFHFAHETNSNLLETKQDNIKDLDKDQSEAEAYWNFRRAFAKAAETLNKKELDAALLMNGGELPPPDIYWPTIHKMIESDLLIDIKIRQRSVTWLRIHGYHVSCEIDRTGRIVPKPKPS